MTAEVLEPLFAQARASARRRDYPAAVQFYRQALAVEADSVDAVEGLAMVLCSSGDLAAAVEQFQRLIQLQPTEARHYVNLGAIHNRQGHHPQAIEVLRKAIQRDRRCADAYYNIGVAQRKLNQLSMAVSAYKEAIRLDPQLVEAYHNLGNAYSEMGNMHLAMANFRKALEIRPEFEKARLALEKAEDAAQQAKAAKNPFGRLVQTDSLAPKAVASVRELSDADRQFDRQRVRQLADELKKLIDADLIDLKAKVEPGVLALQRHLAEGDLKSLVFTRSVNDYQDAISIWQSLRQEVRRKVLELRAHEEVINTPDMNQ